MKKIFTVISTALFLGMIFTGFSPSFDGRAVVAGKGELPAGLFGKTVGYLPGDSVSVVNPANGESVDILVLGSLDPSEGVAILMSPEAAAALKIEKDANNLVKLTKRTGKVDEQVYGTATIAQDSSSEKAVDPVMPSVTEAAVPENTADSALSETAAATVSAPEAAPAVAAEIPAAVAADSALSETTAAPVAGMAESIPAETPSLAAVPAVANAGPALETVPVAAESVPEATSSAAAVEPVLSVAPVEAETPPAAVTADESVPVAAEPVPEAAPAAVAASESVSSEMFAEETPNTAVVVQDEPEVHLNAEETPAEVASVSEPEEAYAPIVLVPSASNPPAAEESAAAEPKKIEEPAVAVPDTVAKNDAGYENLQPAEVLDNYDSYIVPSLKELTSGKYYVQISVLKDSEHIKNIINTYKGNYPLVMVPLSNGTASQVLVGPLERDEYGTVLQKFKAAGFKDAFLRKIR